MSITEAKSIDDEASSSKTDGTDQTPAKAEAGQSRTSLDSTTDLVNDMCTAVVKSVDDEANDLIHRLSGCEEDPRIYVCLKPSLLNFLTICVIEWLAFKTLCSFSLSIVVAVDHNSL